jgi:hypothetical protein
LTEPVSLSFAYSHLNCFNSRLELRDVGRDHIPKDFARRGMILVAKHIADPSNSAASRFPVEELSIPRVFGG